MKRYRVIASCYVSGVGTVSTTSVWRWRWLAEFDAWLFKLVNDDAACIKIFEIWLPHGLR